MNERSTAFEKACEIAFDEEHWQKINYNTGCYERNYAKSMDNYKKLDLERRRAYIIRNKSIQNLEKLLVEFETNFCNNGGTVLWARDAADARDADTCLPHAGRLVGRRSAAPSRGTADA